VSRKIIQTSYNGCPVVIYRGESNLVGLQVCFARLLHDTSRQIFPGNTTCTTYGMKYSQNYCTFSFQSHPRVRVSHFEIACCSQFEFDREFGQLLLSGLISVRWEHHHQSGRMDWMHGTCLTSWFWSFGVSLEENPSCAWEPYSTLG
jgi:hypothetical protein